MSLATATVEFVPLRNDLANLPQSLSGMLFTANIPAQNAVVELQPATKPSDGSKNMSLYLGWTGLSSKSNDVIELDPTFASTIGISHGQKVKISVSAQTPMAHTIHLEPITTGDWEIMETHVAFLENFMINQVRAVAVGQPITVFPSPTAIATLQVKSIVPPPPRVARISPDSEVIVAPKSHKDDGDETPETIANNVQNSQPTSVIRRVSVYPYIEGSDSRALEIKGDLPAGFKSGSYVMVSNVVPPALSSPGSNNSEDEAEVTRARFVYGIYYRTTQPVLGISYGLSNALGLIGDSGIGAKLHVKSIPNQNELKHSVNASLKPYKFHTNSKINSNKAVLLTADELSALGFGLIGKGLVVPPIQPFLPNGGIIDTEGKEWGKPGKITWGTESPLPESKHMKLQVEVLSGSERQVVGQDKLINTLLKSLVGGSNVLVHGSRGCGKSVVINTLLAKLKKRHVKPCIFKCSTYAEKALPTVRDALKKLSLESQWCSPSVVVFDDIDKLIPSQQEHNNDSVRHQQIAEVFKNIWEPIISMGGVSILASAQGMFETHPYLLSSHLLDSVAHLKSPDKELREKILRYAIDSLGLKPHPKLDLVEVVGETEGYQPGDLWILVERLSAMMALNESGVCENLVTTSGFLDAASDFTPACLRGVKLERPNVKWEDVGGLTFAKRTVLETLEWPTKYAPIFANCPLRLRSGLLLYGYPGCGKTMLASAIASQTGLNFISVKGPEILNKYIGASEQSVRDLFDRAQAAKPCVLFFDEFDSIAPKRGHDATGVTDRVVNQLLTQMDGAEGLDGVYVLAATSRPDLIDSALLRPGRLDKSLLCGMPSINDRYDIMVRAAKKLKLAPEIDLNTIAKKTDRFSGADLQALVYNAYLNAVHGVLNQRALNGEDKITKRVNSDEVCMNAFQIGPGDLEMAKHYVRLENVSSDINEPNENWSEKPASTAENVIISKADMDKALLESKPSISPQELFKFQAIYAEFSTDRNGEMPSGAPSKEIGGRVTLQ